VVVFTYHISEVYFTLKLGSKLLIAFLSIVVVISPSIATPTSAKQAASTQPKAAEDLTTAVGIEKYLNNKYGGKFILKTSLAEIPFVFSVSINKSKFEQYDILINFQYDVKRIDQLIFENENSIDPLDNARAINTKAQIKKFIQTYAVDITNKLPKKKIKGQTDGGYYRYPNIKQDYIPYLQNMWVNYDFVDADSIFADYYGNLADYSETVVSKFKWAPQRL
jgi:hypothetical protein